MKLFFHLLLASLLVISCERNTRTPKISTVKKDSVSSRNNFISMDSIEAQGQRIRDTNYAYLSKLLDSALSLAQKKGFTHPFSFMVDTNVFAFKNMSAGVQFGHIFSPDRWHLVIKRFMNEYVEYETSLYSDIYLVKNNSLSKVVADTNDISNPENYLEDVNHDGYKDYIVYSYSGTGCCPRNDETAYLYNRATGRFVPDGFFNREPGPTPDLLYETSYGLGDFINLYKYKWRGLKKVLLEEIYVTPVPEKKGTKKTITYTRVFYPSGKKQILKRLPAEYKRLQMSEYITEGN